MLEASLITQIGKKDEEIKLLQAKEHEAIKNKVLNNDYNSMKEHSRHNTTIPGQIQQIKSTSPNKGQIKPDQ